MSMNTRVMTRIEQLNLPEFELKTSFLYLLICAGIILRCLTFWFVPASTDAFVYAAMGESFLKNGEFILPQGNSFFVPGEPEYSHHFAPMYALYLSLFFIPFGMSVEALKCASIISGILIIPVVYLCTANIWGRKMGLYASALFAVEPTSTYLGGLGFAENLLFVFFILTMWAILRGIKDERYIAWAGLFAGLAYLTKSSMGWFFLFAGMCGFVWRFYYIRWRVFRSKYYMLGIALFVLFFGVWGVRNIMHFWDGTLPGIFSAWETSDYISHVQWVIFTQPEPFLYAFVLRIPMFILFFLMLAWPWLLEMKAMKKLEERNSALFLSIFLVYIVGMYFASAFWVFEHHPLFWFLIIRYVMPANISIIWLVINYYANQEQEMSSSHTPPEKCGVKPETRRKNVFAFNRGYVASFITLFVIAILVCTPMTGIPRERGEIKALAWLRDHGHENMSIAIEDVHQYEVYVYLSQWHARILAINNSPSAEYILTAHMDENYSAYGYTILHTFYSSGGFLASLNSPADVILWKKNLSHAFVS